MPRICRLPGQRRPLVLLLVLLLALVGAGPAQASTRAATPQHIQLVLPLVADGAGLAAFAHAVSTPGSPQYGQFEPVALLAQRFGARATTKLRTLRFLRAAGATAASVNPTGLFAQATFSVAEAEQAFGTELHEVGAGAHGAARFMAPVARAHVSAAPAGLPLGLRGLATGVIGLDTRPVLAGSTPSKARVAAARRASGYLPASGTPSGCPAAVASGGFTPNQYLSAYGISPLRANGLSGQGERLALIEVDGFKLSDLRTFAACFGFRVPRVNVFPVGTSRALPPGGESTLDLQVVDSVAPQLSAIDVYENSGNAAQVTRSLVLPLLNPGAKPQVISASLGLCEPSMVSAFGTAGIALVERDVELSAATGITLVAASGDNGSSACSDSKGRVTHRLAVSYPASSPYVTSVGGTNLILSAANTISAQEVWNDTPVVAAAGGGGFSQLFGRPSYQAKVVSGARRAVPDVAMLADLAPGYAIYCTAAGNPDCPGSSPWEQVGGTSAAAPLLAAGTALVDQDLSRQGREQLGFLNPLLYSIGSSAAAASVFSDVTSGGNDVGAYLPGANGVVLGCCSAMPGFDAASGFGSVNLAALDLVAQSRLPRLGKLTVSLSGGQHPGRSGTLKVKLGCSQSCSVYALSIITLGDGTAFSAQSTSHRLRRAGSFTAAVRLSRSEQSAVRAALAGRRTVYAEVFAVGLDARGHTAKVTPGVAARIHG